MKWRKRLLLLALFVAVFAIATLGAGWWMSRGEPEWFTHRKLDPQEMEAAAARAERQMQRTLNWAQEQQALAASTANGKPSTHPSKEIEVSFTQDELNGFFQKWDSTFGWSAAYGAYLSEPQVALRDGRLICAATVTDLGSVLSVEFVPKLEGNQLFLSVGRVLAGRLPLPASFWAKYRGKVAQAVEAHLPAWRRQAEITPQGGANSDAVAAAMTELLLDMLEDRPAPPVLFLPYAMQSRPRSLPVKIKDLRIEGTTLTMTVEPLDAAGVARCDSHTFSCPSRSPITQKCGAGSADRPQVLRWVQCFSATNNAIPFFQLNPANPMYSDNYDGNFERIATRNAMWHGA